MDDKAVIDATNDDGELEFQNFSFTESSKGKYKPVSLNQPPEWESAPTTEHTAPNHPFYSLEYYMNFFDVDTSQVLNRCLRTFPPYSFVSSFFTFLSSSPDLYGPFWISSTLVFVIFVCANISASLLPRNDGTTFSPDFEMLSISATTIYCYVFLMPLILWGICRYYKMPSTLLELICLYGYSLTIFIPVSIICVAPVPAVKWSFSLIAFLLSGIFISKNIFQAGKEENKFLALVLAAVALGCHFGLTLLFKFIFFTYL